MEPTALYFAGAIVQNREKEESLQKFCCRMLLLLNYRKHLFQESFNIGVRHHNIYYLDLSVNILLCCNFFVAFTKSFPFFSPDSVLVARMLFCGISFILYMRFLAYVRI